MKKNINKISAGIAVVGFLVIASVAYAQTTATVKTFLNHGGHAMVSRPVVGTVSAIASPASLTLTVQSSSTAAITVYTVNTASAKVFRTGTSTSVSSIQLNDKIAVVGTVSGTNITAKVIFDGVMPHTTGPPTGNKGGHAGSTSGRSFASSTRPSFVRPAAFGSISAITSDSSFTLAERTKTGTTTMTINTDSSTMFREGTTTAEFSSLAVGNLVAVTGTTTSVDQILAGKVIIMPKMSLGSFGKGKGFMGKGFGGHKMGWPKDSLKNLASTTPQ